MPKQFDAVVAGYLGADLAPLFPRGGEALPLAQLLRPGKLVEVGPLEISTGGVVANTGLAMAHFGCQTALMGLLGTDALGDLLLSLLTDRGPALHLRRTDVAGTAYGIVIAPPGTDRVFLECPGCNATFGADDLDYAVIAQSRLFHFGYPPLMPRLFADGGAELEAIFTRVRELGVATSLDMTLPDPQGPAGAVEWSALLARVLPHVDIFVPSIEELAYMLAHEEWARLTAAVGEGDVSELVPEGLVRDLADTVLQMGVRVLLLKSGAHGGYLRTRDTGGLLGLGDAWQNRALWLQPCPVETSRFVNACGAGDAAVAGFLTAMLRGASPERAGQLAMIAGRDSLYGADTTSGLADWTAMQDEATTLSS